MHFQEKCQKQLAPRFVVRKGGRQTAEEIARSRSQLFGAWDHCGSDRHVVLEAKAEQVPLELFGEL